MPDLDRSDLDRSDLDRSELVRRFKSVAGPLPGMDRRVPLDVEVIEEVDRGTHRQCLINYSAEPGGRTPAYLLLPRIATAERPRPGVLALHPTEHRIGHRVTVEPVGARNRDYGRQLAEAGFVVLAPAYPLLADHQPDLTALGYVSGTMKAIWDNIRGLDLLAGLPEVAGEGFGAVGHSLGGHNAIFTAVFEPRIRVVFSSCGFDSFADYMGGDLSGWRQQRYLPRLAGLDRPPFDFDQLLAALAPRDVLVSAPTGDDNFGWRSAARMVDRARPAWRRDGAADRLSLLHPGCGHDLPDEVLARAIALLAARLPVGG